MMDEKDAIALTTMAIGSTKGTVDNSVCDNGSAAVSKETFETMMNSIDSRLSTLNKSVTILNEKMSSMDKRVYHLEYNEHDVKSSLILDILKMRKELDLLIHRVDQMEMALNMSKKYRKRRAKISKD